jgi:cytochrome c oxidase cbb3-type subunit 4
MESIEGIEIYPIISILIFFIFFALLILWVATAKKNYIEQVSNIPLEQEEEENQLKL